MREITKSRERQWLNVVWKNLSRGEIDNLQVDSKMAHTNRDDVRIQLSFFFFFFWVSRKDRSAGERVNSVMMRGPSGRRPRITDCANSRDYVVSATGRVVFHRGYDWSAPLKHGCTLGSKFGANMTTYLL